MNRSFAFIVCASLLAVIATNAFCDETASTWIPWKHTLLSAVAYDNPCSEVSIGVTFRGPDGKGFHTQGYWDGDNRFIVSSAFPAAGEWTWVTSCSDSANTGIDKQSGVVHVVSAKGMTPFSRHGYLSVSPDGRYLTHADGTPFLWIGDTCWAAPIHATDDEWLSYVKDRAKKGYSVLQLSIAPKWALEHARVNGDPFLSTLPDITKPNPRYFRELERKIALANEHGLAVMLCGLMETPYEYPPVEQVTVFSRYVAARLGAHAIVFSPSFDSNIREEISVASASAIRDAAPNSLVTMHMGTAVGPHFHGSEWLDFDMYQSGHNGGNRARQAGQAMTMPADILALPKRKPIVNGEAIYEGDNNGTAFDVRRTAWLSFLSGAVGYTAGIKELYEWAPNATIQMELVSSNNVSILGAVLRSFEWWNLDPATGRILNQPEDRERWMAFAMTRDASVALAYLPEGRTIELNLADTSHTYAAVWLSPITAERVSEPPAFSGAHCAFHAPDSRDWVLVLTADGSDTRDLIAKAARSKSRELARPKGDLSYTPGARFDGLSPKEAADGELVQRMSDGTACLVNEKPEQNQYLYMDVDDQVIFRDGPRDWIIRVRLATSGECGGMQLQYDAIGEATTENTYRGVPPRTVEKRGAWTELTFAADRVYFGNRQNGGSDFRIFLAGNACQIVKVTANY